MSKGFGYVERWILSRVGNEPMSFQQLLDASYPPGSYDNDMAKAIGGSNVGSVRSLRRALGKLCDLDIIQIKGRRPHRYCLHRLFADDAYNARAIELGYRCLSFEEGETLEAKNTAGRARFKKAFSEPLPLPSEPLPNQQQHERGECNEA